MFFTTSTVNPYNFHEITLLFTYQDLRAKKHQDKTSLSVLEKPADWSYDFFSPVKNDVSMF